jgi:biotin operon repressor
MNKKIYKEDIWKIISEHVGEDNAISQQEIATEYFSFAARYQNISERAVRRLIRALREEGYPILSSPHYPNGGYFIPNSYDEVKAWQKRMHIKAVKLLAIVNPVIVSCQNMFPDRDGKEQLKIFKGVIK